MNAKATFMFILILIINCHVNAQDFYAPGGIVGISSTPKKVMIGDGTVVEPFSGYDGQNNTTLQILGNTGVFGMPYLVLHQRANNEFTGSISFSRDGYSIWDNRTGLIYSKYISLNGGGELQFYTRPDSLSAIVQNMTISTAGNVGIGISNPTEKLEVNGHIVNGGSDFRLGQLDGKNQGVNLLNRALVHTDWNPLDGLTNDVLTMNFGGDFEGGILFDGPGGWFKEMVCIGTNKHPAMTAADGSPYRLYVNGGALLKEVKVELGWADHVLEADYCRPSLEEEAAFIDANGHLSGFESAKTMNGYINLGDVTRRQQIKIEEMRLDQIDSYNQIQTLEEKVDIQDQQIKQLMQAVEALQEEVDKLKK